MLETDRIYFKEGNRSEKNNYNTKKQIWIF